MDHRPSQQDSKIVAAVDLGSNSFHMIIGKVEQGRFRKLDALKESVRLRMGLTEDGTVSELARERALACLARFGQRLRGIPRENIRVVGTNTLRSAREAYQFLKEIEGTLGVPVEVIGGREEARLIYMGVAQKLPNTDERFFVVDVGGGSTEFILGQGKEPRLMESRPMGCVSYTLQFFPEGLITKKRMQKAMKHVGYELEPYRRVFFRDQWQLAIGTSGTAKALATILTHMGETQNRLTLQGLKLIATHLIQVGNMAGHRLPGLREDRVAVLPGGLAILYGIFRELGIDSMDISQQSLRDGVIQDFIGREHRDKRRETVQYMMSFYGVDREQAERVKKTALYLFPQIENAMVHDPIKTKALVGWAAEMHEIGLAVAHANYHKHGAYLLLNSDMAGFSRGEQGVLYALVVNHRKSLKKLTLPYDQQQDWPMFLPLRLAVIFNRERLQMPHPQMTLALQNTQITLHLEAGWLRHHPLTRADLEMEKQSWEKIGYSFILQD